MYFKQVDLDIIAPALIQQPWNEAAVLGSAVWLWMQSEPHLNLPLHTLSPLLLPAIKKQQFLLACHAGHPVFYLSWANFSEEAEQRYLQQHPVEMPEADWNSGDRGWILDWVAPFGHTRALANLIRRQFFANRCMQFLYHRGRERGLQVKHVSGSALLPAEVQEWFATHPVRWNPQALTQPDMQKELV